jgi:hypothetical protein
MLSDLVTVTFVILAAILLSSPWTIARFRRFDANNRARILAERSDRGDVQAHFRHTLKLAEEQVEEVSSVTVSDPRTGTPVQLWLFEGERFLNEEDARVAREARMRDIARGFYVDLPRALAQRKEDDRLAS